MAEVRDMLELSREECIGLLSAHSFGRLAVAGGGKAPVIRPVNYVFDPGAQAVAFRTAAGSKFHALVSSTDASFEIDGVEEETRTGWSVIITGMTEEVLVAGDLNRLEQLGLDTWAPGAGGHWIRIRAYTVSGRRISSGESAG